MTATPLMHQRLVMSGLELSIDDITWGAWRRRCATSPDP